ncbi:hypothetical protein QFC19_007101 [Naganishia cerealis]|uniref:Uncharacterized protein n=1 Tax=Naganishia cerealis TaxID=610337 RepID=A0ACC2VC56_9TREE|nr:hypothetical protein QFC19_007101 [Naganishia cerealis]
MASRPRSQYVDDEEDDFEILQGQENPFTDDDSKYRFEVSEIAIGSMDGRNLKFYEGISYPTDNKRSCIRFDKQRARFHFDIHALPQGVQPQVSHPHAFPYVTAPRHAQYIDAQVEMTDVMSRGIACVKDEQTTTFWRSVAAPESQESRRGTGENGTSIGNRQNGRAKSPVSVHSASDDDDFGRAPSPVTELIPTKTSRVVLTISLRRPPRFHVPITNRSGKRITVHHGKRRITRRQATSWDFTDVDMHGTKPCDEVDAGTISVWAEQETFKISQFLTYRFTLYLTSYQYNMLTRLLQRLRIYSVKTRPDLRIAGHNGAQAQDASIISARSEGVLRKSLKSYGMPTLPGKSLPGQSNNFDHAGLSNFAQPGDLVRLAGELAGLLNEQKFSMRWLIEGLVSHGIILPFEVHQLLSALQKHCPTRSGGKNGSYGAEQELKYQERILTAMFNEERIRDINTYVKKKAALAKSAKFVEDPPHIVRIRRVYVTPSKILLFPPEPETGNSVLRAFKNPECFIRVTMTDEDDRIQMNPSVRAVDGINESVGTLARIRRVLNHGLFLAGQKFEFLAASASQMREHGCWYVSSSGSDLGAKQIRRWMGNIEETIVAKYASRMGIPFSTTREVRGASIQRLPNAEDVKVGKYTFTDGAGLCSQELAAATARVLGIKGSGHDATPSAIQVRIGGAKGVLAVSKRLTGFTYQLRDSMIKYESDRTEFCVVRSAIYNKATLNRQYIALLSALGIPDETFINMFNAEVRQIRGLPKRFANNTYEKTIDMKLVQMMCHFPVKPLVEAGFGKDACIQGLLRVLEVRLLYDLKWRARLSVEKGVFLMGVPDEYGILKEGEIFCQWQDPEKLNSAPQIVEGDCILCRAPAMHTGDVRRVKAVNNPSFHHLRNVIVFNVQGARDLPNQLGGGDLDGDDYTLIWDPKLIIERNAMPMDYTPPDPTRVDRVSLPFIKANFVNHLKNDMLGQIANNHLAWTDLKSPFSYECSQLSRLHSVAVDFAKTGVPADLPIGLRVFKWPDFMGKPDNTYRSEKILGKLFRIVDPEPVFEELSQSEVDEGIDYLLTKPTIPLSILKIVAKAKVAYDTEVWQLLIRYRLSEAEAFSGIVLKNLKRRKIKDHDLKDPVKDAFQIIVEEAKQSILEAYTAEVGNQRRSYNSAPLGGKISSNQMLAVAVYQVAYYSRHQHLTDEWEDEDAQNFTNIDEALMDADIEDVDKK